VSLSYRPEIDGLRSVAVIPVILFHAGLPFFSGGFVGVDIFFVISGYLITTILIKDIEAGQFSLLKFYERRARRILPALFLVILCCLPFAWAWMMPSQFRDFGQSLVGVAFFVSNVLFWKETDYFANAAEEKPLLHTWSLAVEEQYYIFFPLVLLVFWRLGRAQAFWVIAVLGMFSLALSEWSSRTWPAANFYLIHTRAWELFAGSLAAFLIRRTGPGHNDFAAAAGLVMIGLSIFTFDETVRFPSLYALLPVGGTVLIVLYGGATTWVGRLLGLAPFVGIGLLSYSAYLWHQPLLAFARIRTLDEPSHLAFLLIALLSFPLAWLSWRYVEQPFRGPTPLLPHRQSLFAVCGIGLLAFSGAGFWIYQQHGMPGRFPPQIQEIIAFADDKGPNRKYCNATRHPSGPHPLQGCDGFLSEDGTADVVIIGDSHALSISYPLQQVLKDQQGLSSYMAFIPGCIGLRGFQRVGEPNVTLCDDFNTGLLDFARQSGAQTLVISSRFQRHLLGVNFDNGEGGVETGREPYVDVLTNGPSSADIADPARQARVLSAFKAQLEALTEEFNVVLGPVDNHLEAMSAATRFQHAA
jgi:peptidoglycan/LPS O-acetylase OafA/YrhL